MFRGARPGGLEAGASVQRVPGLEAGASVQRVPGLEPWNEEWDEGVAGL